MTRITIAQLPAQFRPLDLPRRQELFLRRGAHRGRVLLPAVTQSAVVITVETGIIQAGTLRQAGEGFVLVDRAEIRSRCTDTDDREGVGEVHVVGSALGMAKGVASREHGSLQIDLS